MNTLVTAQKALESVVRICPGNLPLSTERRWDCSWEPLKCFHEAPGGGRSIVAAPADLPA